MDPGEERIGLKKAAAVLGRSASTVRRYVADGRLQAERESGGAYTFDAAEVRNLASGLNAGEEEVFEGEIMGDEAPEGSNLPAVPFERYERLLQQGQDYKTRLEERSRQVEEVRKERDAARVEIDRLWSEIERLNVIEFQRELQEKTISTLEEEKATLASEHERLLNERFELMEEKSSLIEERIRLESELKAAKNRGFFARLFGGG